jgi:hypothetical protein
MSRRDVRWEIMKYKASLFCFFNKDVSMHVRFFFVFFFNKHVSMHVRYFRVFHFPCFECLNNVY